MKFVLASTNKGKIEEFKKLFKNLDFELLTLEDFDIPNIDEDGISFEENSLIKARAVSKITNLPTISDDSGLCIKALNEKPGIYTARYFPECLDYNCKCNKMIELVNETKSENRDAKFVCVITIYFPNGDKEVFRGEAEGKILKELRGELGHGYDPIFFSNDLKKSFAEATLIEKNKVSHRARAFLKLENYLRNKKW